MDTPEHPLVSEFKQYLAAADAPISADRVSQFDQIAEFNALKAEVKRGGRQFKEAMAHFKAALDASEKSQAVLQQELEQRRAQEQTLRREILRPVLLGFLDLYDRMAAGTLARPPELKGAAAFFGKQEHKWVIAMQEGQQMSLRRFDQLLEEHQVTPIAALGKRLDPQCMRAVEVDSLAEVEEGVVTQEVRKGFLWDGQLLRTAEVRVNKKT